MTSENARLLLAIFAIFLAFLIGLTAVGATKNLNINAPCVVVLNGTCNSGPITSPQGERDQALLKAPQLAPAVTAEPKPHKARKKPGTKPKRRRHRAVAKSGGGHSCHGRI
jgi:hypothetical protein